MASYRIHNRISGADVGVFEAEDPAAALDAMAREAGYRDFGQAVDTTGDDPNDLVVEELDE